MLFGLFGKKRFLGIDIGTSYIKIIEVQKGRKAPKLVNYGEVGVPQPETNAFRNFSSENLMLSNQDIASALLQGRRQAGIKTREVNFSIPDFSSFFINFALPKMTKQEFSQAIQYEVRPYVPIPLSEVTLDWVVTEGKPGETPVKILAVAIPNDVIKQYQEVARLAKLKLKFLEPEVFSLARAMKPVLQETNVAALIDIGARTTTCSILDKGILKTSNSFNVSSNQLTDLLAKSLNLDYNKAEEVKRTKGLSEKTLMPLIDEMVGEIRSILEDFSNAENKEIDKIILSGGSALLPGLKEYFKQELQKETIIADPFVNISKPQVLESVLKESGPAYVVALGAALKGLE